MRWLLCVMLLGVASPTLAQEAKVEVEEDPFDWTVETDLLPWIGAGFMARAGVLLKPSRISVLLEVFGQTLDPTGTFLFVSGEPEGLDARLEFGVDAIVRYHFSPDAKGFHAGLGVGGERFRIRPEGATAGAERRYFNVFLAPRAGYLWFPFQDTFYVSAEAVVVVPVLRSNAVEVDGVPWALRDFIFYPAIGAGARF